MLTPTIQIKNLTLAYQSDIVFSRINLDLTPCKWVALLGISGVGKSSLLRVLAGLSIAQGKLQGTIETDNHIPLHQQIAYMAQTDLLLPWLTVFENTTLKLKLRTHSPNEYTQEANRAKDLLEKTGLGKVLDFFPHQLSGGMRQRVALVRTLMENKPIVLMDEPFSALDTLTRYKLQHLAADLMRDKTVLFITHDPTEALVLADEIYIMQGQPASLNHFTSLTAAKPRCLMHPDVIQLQARLFNHLKEEMDASC